MSKLVISKFSSCYNVRRLSEKDVPAIYALCKENKLYYDYCGKEPTVELIRSDLEIVPPGKDLSDKFYIGFFENNKMVAVMDLIDGYPEKDMAFIGFFMVEFNYQGKGLGSQLIADLCKYLKHEKYRAVRLGIDEGNPQSTGFWKKNCFEIIKEVEMAEGVILLAELSL